MPIAPALIALTVLQMLTACALFAPGVMAPRIGIDATTLGLYATAPCVVGFFIAFVAGTLTTRFGSFRIATVCAVAIIGAMALAAWSGASGTLVLAGVLLGFAYGPETPASSAMLFRITPPDKRPLVFSLRQTGNQSGAIVGSLALPVLAALDPVYGYAAIVALALLALLAFEWLRPRYDPLVRGASSSIRLREALRLLLASRDMRGLAIIAVPFSALQIVLNMFLVSLAVQQLRLDLIAAGVLLAAAQAGGLTGRLLFGLLATRHVAPWTTLVALGVAMSACAVAMALAGPAWPWPLLLVLAFCFGLTASGWNGVYLAEVARLAPEGRVGEATGAVLMFGFAGLILGPLFTAAVTALASLTVAFALLGVATLCGTLVLLGRGR